MKVRTKFASVIDFATASGWFTATILRPADHGQAAAGRPQGRPHEAMPSAELPAFMRDLAAFDTPAARALQFTVLTAARASETLRRAWSEIQGDVWSIPASA